MAAKALAEAGIETRLVDKHEFPRNKSCGDALLPDALAVLRTAGIEHEVLRHARRLEEIRIFAPNGVHVSLRGQAAVIPRREFDHLLLRKAVGAGVDFKPRHSLVSALTADGRVRGAVFRNLDTEATVEISADITLLATGAAAVPLRAFGVATRETPSATAVRCYVSVDEETAAGMDHLSISFEKTICPGYGWLFPGPDATVNVGVGYFYDAARMPPTKNLRELLDRFLGTFPPAVELMRRGRIVSPIEGAPLRTGLTGTLLSKPGLLVIGEAAGLTYSFSGEGIGKAMDSGVRAARVVADHFRLPSVDFDELAASYASDVTASFATRFQAYRSAQRWLGRPALANLLARRANSGSYARTQLEGLVTEATDPRSLFSFTGLARALLR